MQWFSVSRHRGTSSVVGFYTLTPESLAITLRGPRFGLVWRLPLAVHVTRRGHTRVVPIVDVTRAIQILLALVTLVAATRSAAKPPNRIPKKERSA
ncbi:MAG: hypothetical protein H3C34_09075 [Caldilineaceae bacterium]|nr:hypothetical protein [Caldilineaceae bacterium]